MVLVCCGLPAVKSYMHGSWTLEESLCRTIPGVVFNLIGRRSCTLTAFGPGHQTSILHYVLSLQLAVRWAAGRKRKTCAPPFLV